jgi:hypothetical protein
MVMPSKLLRRLPLTKRPQKSVLLFLSGTKNEMLWVHEDVLDLSRSYIEQRPRTKEEEGRIIDIMVLPDIDMSTQMALLSIRVSIDDGVFGLSEHIVSLKDVRSTIASYTESGDGDPVSSNKSIDLRRYFPVSDGDEDDSPEVQDLFKESSSSAL